MLNVKPETWMTDLFPLICKRKLTELFIPGSHNSAINFDCVSQPLPLIGLKWATDLGPDAPEDLKNSAIPGLTGILGGIIRGWSVTQQLSLQDQLHAGIRYFDLRIAKIDGVFKFTHGLLSHHDIFTILEPVETFMRAHPGEVLIVHCQHFHNMQDPEGDFNELLSVFQTRFSDMLAVNSVSQDEFQTYINSGKRIVLVWGEGKASFLANPSLVYDEAGVLKTDWPRTKKTKEDLAQFLINKQGGREAPYDKLSVVQGILDSDDLGIGFLTEFSLLEWEKDLNSYLMTNVLAKLGTSRGFIYMTDNVMHPDGQAIAAVIRLHGDVSVSL